MADTLRSKTDRVNMGIWLDRPDREEAQRIATALGVTVTTVIRMAVKAGLPEIDRRLNSPDVSDRGRGST